MMVDYDSNIPIQYQEKKSKFKDLDLFVDERVFIPRPETELLVDVVVDEFSKGAIFQPEILELCTGSGAVSVALAAELSFCSIEAVDISEDAITVARENIQRYGLDGKITLHVSDLTEYLRKCDRRFNCIVSNPPYVSESDYKKVDVWVKKEPSIAFLAGEEGLDLIDSILKLSKKALLPGGFLAIEIGYDQAYKVKRMFLDHGFTGVKSYLDFNGYQRVIAGWVDG